MPEIINDETGLETKEDNEGEGEKRSEKRIRDLSNKVSNLAKEKEELAKQHEVEKSQLLKEKQDVEFRASFLEASSKYPNAKEFEADIKTKVSSGYTLDDAIISTLASKGKLETAPPSKTDAMGGSVDTTINEVKKNDPSFGGDKTKMREELVNLEKKGEIGLRF